MALLDQLAEGCFRKLDDGWVFRPWRVLGQSYRVSEAQKVALAEFVSGHAEVAVLVVAARLIAEQVLAEDMPDSFAGLASFANGVTAAALVVILASYAFRLRKKLAGPVVRERWPAADGDGETDDPGTVVFLAVAGGIATIAAVYLAVDTLIEGDLTGMATALVGAGLVGTFSAPYVRTSIEHLLRWKRDCTVRRRGP